MKSFLEGGEIVAAGARTIAAGGWQSIPRLDMPGAMLIGDSGGGVNVPKIKGIHQAIRSDVGRGKPGGSGLVRLASMPAGAPRRVDRPRPGHERLGSAPAASTATSATDPEKVLAVLVLVIALVITLVLLGLQWLDSGAPAATSAPGLPAYSIQGEQA